MGPACRRRANCLVLSKRSRVARRLRSANSFWRDAEALIERVNEALGGEFVWQRPWRLKVGVGAVCSSTAAAAARLDRASVWTPGAETRQEVKSEQDRQVKAAATETQGKRNAEEAEQQRIAAAKAENEMKAKAAAEEAEQQRIAACQGREREEGQGCGRRSERQQIAAAKAEEEKKTKAAAIAEQQRLASLKAEDDRKRAEAETRTRYTTLVSQSNTDINAGNYDRAIASLSEAIRLNPDDQGLALSSEESPMGVKATTNELSPISAKLFDSTRSRFSLLGTGG